MLELRPDVPVPPEFDGTAPDGSTPLVAVEVGTAGRPPRPVAVLVTRIDRAVARVDQVWIAGEARGDVEAELLTALRDRYRQDGASVLLINVAPDQTELAALLHDAPVTDVYMAKSVTADVTDPPAGYGTRPMTPSEYEPWVRAQIETYAQHNLPRLGGDIDLARERSQRSFAELLPDGPDTADTDVLVLTWHEEPVGQLWLRHHWASDRAGLPAVQSYIFDVEITAARRGEGLGRAALVVAERLTLTAGDHELGLHVFGHNTVARGLYASYGFEAVETTYDALGGCLARDADGRRG